MGSKTTRKKKKAAAKKAVAVNSETQVNKRKKMTDVNALA